MILPFQISVQSDKHFSGLANIIGLDSTCMPSLGRARCFFSFFFFTFRFLISFFLSVMTSIT